MLLLGVAATSIALFQAVNARRSEAEQRQIAEAVNKFLNEDILAAPRPERLGPNVTVHKAIDAASESISGRFVDEPLLEASIRSTLATSGRTRSRRAAT